VINMNNRLFIRLFSPVMLVAAMNVFAQEAKAPDKAAASSVPKHNCVRPDAPAKFESDAQQKIFVKQMDGYRDCLMAYRNEMNKVAQAHIDAANGAIEEFNGFVGAINKK